ncbi:bro-2 [Sucra jujuba nucleopolyhedrovirus]|uniref:Bro-2 n=1 Tax=Sucra jujuba nucleopolyhedrovirus TaxID=1563660 RepID=A0A097P8X9_9ABAC|nr:bro-2 [Sucra jujuba nucleopolyhedrovirus]AIU41286.1 bro-2 [Sucra jujuba nucleopolyhedrovirus]
MYKKILLKKTKGCGKRGVKELRRNLLRFHHRPTHCYVKQSQNFNLMTKILRRRHKPKNKKLLHVLVVCELSDDRFAFLRTQTRSLKRALKNLCRNESKQAPSKSPIVVMHVVHVPNSINLYNRLKNVYQKINLNRKIM